MSYKDIYGHEKQISVLKTAVTSDRIPHAYLFYGMEGIGKRTVAEIFAKALNCTKAKKLRQLYEAADALGGKYGKHTMHLGGSHPIEVFGKGRRGVPTVREQTRMYGETKRKHLGLPILHVKT